MSIVSPTEETGSQEKSVLCTGRTNQSTKPPKNIVTGVTAPISLPSLTFDQKVSE